MSKNRRLSLYRIDKLGLRDDLKEFANDDIWWDTVKHVEYIENTQTYDVTILDGEPNFVVDGFITHNTGMAEALSWMILMLYDPSSNWVASEDKSSEILPAIDGVAYIIAWKVRGGFRVHADDCPGAIAVPFKGSRGWHPKQSKWFSLKKLA